MIIISNLTETMIIIVLVYFYLLFQCPSTLKEELSYNPFLRTSNEIILKKAGMIPGEDLTEFTSPGDDVRAEALKEIRDQKDKFKYIMWFAHNLHVGHILSYNLSYLSKVLGGTSLSKQGRTWSDAAFCSIWSGSTLFAAHPTDFRHINR